MCIRDRLLVLLLLVHNNMLSEVKVCVKNRAEYRLFCFLAIFVTWCLLWLILVLGAMWVSCFITAIFVEILQCGYVQYSQVSSSHFDTEQLRLLPKLLRRLKSFCLWLRRVKLRDWKHLGEYCAGRIGCSRSSEQPTTINQRLTAGNALHHLTNDATSVGVSAESITPSCPPTGINSRLRHIRPSAHRTGDAHVAAENWSCTTGLEKPPITDRTFSGSLTPIRLQAKNGQIHADTPISIQSQEPSISTEFSWQIRYYWIKRVNMPCKTFLFVSSSVQQDILNQVHNKH